MSHCYPPGHTKKILILLIFFHQYCLESLVPKIGKCVDPVPALFFISSVVLHPGVNSCSDKTLFQIELAFTEVGDLTGKLQERAILFV